MPASSLGPGPEFDRIRAIARALGDTAPRLGNDVAYLELPGSLLALSTDTSLEGVHFRREWLSLAEIGWRAAAAALSDLAAAGANCQGLLAALTMPGQEPPESFAELMRGAGGAVSAAGGTVLGGDLTGGDAISLTITVIGTAPRMIGRAGAHPGDALWVTGTLGGARAALVAFQAGREPDPDARRRFASPEPRLELGRALAGRGARAMLDLSDGLAGDATHLAAASGVAVEIRLDALPVNPAAVAEAQRLGEPASHFAARGGEDYELLAAMPPEFDGAGLPVTRIGTIGAGQGVRLLDRDRAVLLAAYQHFA
jgi:thiamine-monophosphate kinase